MSDTGEPTAHLTSDKRVIEIDIKNGQPFDLPVLGHFGGSGGEYLPDGKTIDKSTIKPYKFTPGMVRVIIENGVIKDMGVFARGGFYLVDDFCQNRRSVYDSGVAHIHWPEWLDRLVVEKLTEVLKP